MNKVTLFLVLLVVLNITFVECKTLFLDQSIHDLDPISLSLEDVQQEYNNLEISKTKNGLMVKKIDKSTVCWSIILNDFIDMDIETENRFLQLNFVKLDSNSTMNVIGIDSIDQSQFQRIFIQQNGQVSYVYKHNKGLSEQREDIFYSNNLAKEKTFTWSEGDILEIFYFAEEQSLLIYNQTKDNLFKFPESLINQIGRRFKIFAGISTQNGELLLTNNIS